MILGFDYGVQKQAKDSNEYDQIIMRYQYDSTDNIFMRQSQTSSNDVLITTSLAVSF